MTNYPLNDYPSTPLSHEPDETLYAQRKEATRLAIEKEQKENKQFLTDCLTEVNRDDTTEEQILELFWLYMRSPEKDLANIRHDAGMILFDFLEEQIENQVERELD